MRYRLSIQSKDQKVSCLCFFLFRKCKSERWVSKLNNVQSTAQHLFFKLYYCCEDIIVGYIRAVELGTNVETRKTQHFYEHFTNILCV